MSQDSIAATENGTVPKLVDVKGVADMLTCSSRTVYRLADAGRMPPPLRIGSLVRWSHQAIDEWIAGGCKPVRTATGTARKKTLHLTDTGSRLT